MVSILFTFISTLEGYQDKVYWTSWYEQVTATQLTKKGDSTIIHFYVIRFRKNELDLMSKQEYNHRKPMQIVFSTSSLFC